MRKLIIFLILFTAWVVWDNVRIKASHYNINAPTDLTIGHISDIHDSRLFDKAVNKLKQESPDVIVVTGDVYDGNLNLAIQEMKQLSEIAPTYYISGNHDISYSGFSKFINEISSFVTVLSNEEVNIAGITLYGQSEGSKITSYNSNGFSILLTHHPEAVCTDFDLVLCGHAHGGQIQIPFVGGLYAPGQGLLPKYSRGEYRIKDTILIVSGGLGGPKPRMNNPPEIGIINLRKE